MLLMVFAFPDNPPGENSKSSADFSIQLIPLLECMDDEDKNDDDVKHLSMQSGVR